MAKKASDLGRCSQRLCQQKATAACQFELRGRRAGEACGRPFCADHKAGRFCLPHGRLVYLEHMEGMGKATGESLNRIARGVLSGNAG